MKKHEPKKTAKKGLFRIVFSRSGIMLLLILMQIGVFTITTSRLQAYSTAISGIMLCMRVIVIIYVINSEGNPAFKMTWILCIITFPVVGTLFYIYVKLQVGTRFLKHRLNTLKTEMSQYMVQDKDTVDALWASRSANARLSHYLSNQLNFPTYRNTQVRYFPLGEDKFRCLLAELKKARKFIFMEYHAIENADAWQKIQTVLAERVQAGVEVRVFYDDMGSISFLNHDFAKQLEALGIACRVFNPFVPGVNLFLNNRDHRKITVIDGKIGFTGGYNLANEYFGFSHPYGEWKDTGIRLEGDAVRSLTITFLEMWNAIKKNLPSDRSFEPYLPDEPYKAVQHGYVQPYADSPLDDEQVGEEVYISMANKAEKYCWFITPYLIITDEMTHALTLAAKRGVDVRIITPGIPDKKMVYSVTRSFYHNLVKHGVRIYEWTPGFCHAKMSVADDKMATCGTINLDYRSLYHHFENGCFLADCDAVLEIRDDLIRTMGESREVTEQYKEGRSAGLRLGQLILRLFAELL